MGLIQSIFGTLFGSGRNVVAETAEVFRVNAESQAGRDAAAVAAALAQHGAEFRTTQRGLFDRLMDALNRIPRPAMALGTLGLFVSAMVDPVWFGERMTGLALVPDQLWWLLGAIVTFYFGARTLDVTKQQGAQREIATTLAQAVPQVVAARAQIRGDEPAAEPDNPALADWRNS